MKGSTVSGVIKANDFEQARYGQATRTTPRRPELDLADVQREAEALRAAAQAQADQLLEAAGQEAERLKAEAHAAGHREGVAAGLDDGRAAGHREALQQASHTFTQQHGHLVQAMQACVETLDGDRRQLVAAAKRDLLNLALAVAERVVKAHVACKTDAVVDNLAEAIELAGHGHDVVAGVHPDDLATAERFAASFVEAGRQAQHVSVVADERVDRGGCLVTTAQGEIDARLQTQLQRIAEALQPDRPDRTGDGPEDVANA